MREERGCEEYADELAELALGVLTGRERARDAGPCRVLPALRRGARGPVPGGRHGGAGGPGDGATAGLRGAALRADGRDRCGARARRRLRPSRWVPAVVGVAAAALALGIGLSVTSSLDVASRDQPAARHAESGRDGGPGVENGETVGQVVTFGGDKPWMSMMLDDSTARGTVRLRRRDRGRHDAPVGTFEARRRLRGLDRSAPRRPGDVRTRGGGVAQRDGDRHRHAGLTPTASSSTGRCRACRGPRPARRCSRPAPGSTS